MSKYTTEVRYICEVAAGLDESVGANQVNKVIEVARPKIFDFYYPIFDENYRSVLETKILKHYYLREISSETVGIWRLWLDDMLNNIMPYYNQLYESALLKFNPLIDTDYTIEHEGEGHRDEDVNRNTERTEKDNKTEKEKAQASETKNENAVADGQSNSASTNYNLFSDTPEGGVQGIAGDFMTDDSATLYVSDARRIEDTGEDTSHTETNTNSTTDNTKNTERGYDKQISEKTGDKRVGAFDSTDSFINHIMGKRSSFVSYSKLLKEFRETILNIDLMIINELEPLFFGLW